MLMKGVPSCHLPFLRFMFVPHDFTQTSLCNFGVCGGFADLCRLSTVHGTTLSFWSSDVGSEKAAVSRIRPEILEMTVGWHFHQLSCGERAS